MREEKKSCLFTGHEGHFWEQIGAVLEVVLGLEGSGTVGVVVSSSSSGGRGSVSSC